MGNLFAHLECSVLPQVLERPVILAGRALTWSRESIWLTDIYYNDNRSRKSNEVHKGELGKQNRWGMSNCAKHSLSCPLIRDSSKLRPMNTSSFLG